MRFQGRLRLEKQSHLVFANTTPGLSERRNGSKEAHTPEPSIMRAGLVSFNYFQALSLGRVRLGDEHIPPGASQKRSMIMHRITHHQRTQLFLRTGQRELAPDQSCRQCLREGVVRDRPGPAAKCHSECKAGLEEAGSLCCMFFHP